ncbi:MAG: hypothetical protein F4W89_16250 [Acidobacteria bacterium]|nr:hypothetical protein [Acidobacteriota bacterium]
MRTTLNLSAQALANVRQLAQQRGKTLGAVASELILKALEPEDAPETRNGVPLFSAAGGAGDGDREAVPDIELVNRLRDQKP